MSVKRGPLPAGGTSHIKAAAGQDTGRILRPDVLVAVLGQLRGEGCVQQLGKLSRTCKLVNDCIRSPALGGLWASEAQRVFAWSGRDGPVPATRGYDEYCRWRDIERAQRESSAFSGGYDEGLLAGIALPTPEEAIQMFSGFELCLELEKLPDADSKGGGAAFLARTPLNLAGQNRSFNIEVLASWGNPGTRPGAEGEPGEALLAGVFNVIRWPAEGNDESIDSDDESIEIAAPPCALKLLMRRDDGLYAALGRFAMEGCVPIAAPSERHPGAVMVVLELPIGYLRGLVNCSVVCSFHTERGREGRDTLHSFFVTHDLERVLNDDVDMMAEMGSGGDPFAEYKTSFVPRMAAAIVALDWR